VNLIEKQGEPQHSEFSSSNDRLGDVMIYIHIINATEHSIMDLVIHKRIV